MKRISLGLFTSLCVLSSVLAARRPAWVQGSDPSYPDNLYVVGVGAGDDLDTARSNARAEISKVFQARVKQTLSETETESSSSLGARRGPAAGSQKIDVQTQVITDSLLEGVNIMQTWEDKKKKQYYALAVLNRSVARRSLTLQIADKEQGVRSQLALADKASTPIEKARGYSRALELSRQLDELAARRRVVDTAGGAPDPTSTPTAKIESDLQQALGRIEFVVDARAEPGSRLREALVGKIAALGFEVAGSTQAAASPDKPLLKITCTLATQPFDRGNPSWKFFHWKGTFELADAAPGGKVLISSAPTGSEGHPVEATALAKALSAGEDALAQEAADQISQYVFGRPKSEQ